MWKGQDLFPNPQASYSTVCFTSLFGSLMDNSNTTCQLSPHPIHHHSLFCSAMLPSQMMTSLSFHWLSPNIFPIQSFRISYMVLAKMVVLLHHIVQTISVILIMLLLVASFSVSHFFSAFLYYQLLEASDMCPKYLAQHSI